MSISTDGGTDADAPTRNCPDCESKLTHQLIIEHGAEDQATEYQGWWCLSCSKGMIHCGVCEELHHPGVECKAKRNARIRAADEQFGGMAKVPGEGLVPIAECEDVDGGTAAYRVKDDCPEDDCNGDHLYVLIHNDDFATDPRPLAEYTPVAERCSEFDHQDDDTCSYHRP